MSNNKQERLISKSHKHHKNKKWLVISIGVSVVLVVAFLTVWVIFNNQSNKQLSTDSEKTKIEITAEKVEKTYQLARTVDSNGNKPDTEKVYDEAIAAASDNYLKSLLQLDKAVFLFNKGDYDQALMSAKLAETNSPSANMAQFIASIYEKKNDKINAIEYYKKAIKLINKDDPMAESDKTSYQSKIDRLEL